MADEKVHIEASIPAADFLFKAIEKVVDDAEHSGEMIDLRSHNAAYRYLIDRMDEAYDLMAESLVKQVEKILGIDS